MSRLLSAVAVFVCILFGISPAQAQGLDIFDEIEKQVESELTEDEAEIQRRLAALEAKQRARKARVLVLPWPDSSTTFRNQILQANVRNRIGRAGAKFYPSLDMYQEGRRLRMQNGRAVPPLDQPGYVPDERLAEIRKQVTALSKSVRGFDDTATAARLLRLVNEVWFVDGPETREVLFDIYLAIGRAVFNPANQTPPYFRMVGGDFANYYLYLAAAMVWEERQLGLAVLESRLPNNDVGAQVLEYVARIEDGIHPPIPVSFTDGGLFNARKFTRDYKVLINGLEHFVDDTGIVMVPRGRIDISLERSDGFSMSESVEVVRLDEKIYFAIEVAKQKMGYDLLNRLMEYPEECVPALPDATRATLATFQALHPRDEIYLVIPKLGSVYDVYIWRWEPETGQLRLWLDVNRGFPVRFALLAGGGVIFNGATINQSALDSLTDLNPSEVQQGINPQLDTAQGLIQLQAASIPIDFQFRGHFNRLMFGMGVQFGKNITPDQNGNWVEKYQVGDDNYVVDVPPAEDTGGDLVDPDPPQFRQQFNRKEWNRLVYAQLGVFLLKNAGFGLGPRGFLRFGWTNLPHAWDLSAHIGFTEDPSFGKKEIKGRVVPLIDLDVFAGVILPFGQTLLERQVPNSDPPEFRPTPLPNLGFTLNTGFTF
jgi:hypothetical protein